MCNIIASGPDFSVASKNTASLCSVDAVGGANAEDTSKKSLTWFKCCHNTMQCHPAKHCIIQHIPEEITVYHE